MNYNKFRIWVGRIIGIIFIIFSKNFNFYALIVIALGILIRLWASGYIHKNQEVTLAGPYRIVRHPLYLGNFLNGLGFAIFINVWQLIVLYVPVFLLLYYKKIKLEEKFLISKFGDQYREYQRTTGLFIPNLTKIFNKDDSKFSWQCFIHNKEYLNLLGNVLVIILCLAYRKFIHL